MKNWQIIGIFTISGAILAICLYFAWRVPDMPLETSLSSTSLPLADNQWKKIELEESSNNSTFVLELKHGWLVYRQSGFGGGMAFVPKPE